MCFHENINLRNGQNDFLTGYCTPVYLTAKLIGPHGGLKVEKQKVGQVTDSVEAPYIIELKFNTIEILHICNS